MPPSRIPSLTRQRARQLRRQMTPPERALWRTLRALNRSHGLRFRSQAPIGPYIADFVSFRHRLIIELDGDTHATPEAQHHDERRDAFLRQQGFRVLRFSNRDSVEAIAETILREIGAL